MDPVLLSTVLDVTVIKPNATKCSRCKAYDHVVSQCPFPETGPQGQRFVKISTKRNVDLGNCALDVTSVKNVGGSCHSPNAAAQGPVIARARSPLNYTYFEMHLIDNPDRTYVGYKTGGGHRLSGPTEVCNFAQLALKSC